MPQLKGLSRKKFLNFDNFGKFCGQDFQYLVKIVKFSKKCQIEKILWLKFLKFGKTAKSDN